jgi:PAS domain S-box-containing protein
MPTRVSPDRFLQILDSLDYHLTMYDADWRFTYVNAAAARLLQRTPDELLGQSLWTLFPERVNDDRSRALRDALESGQPQHGQHFVEPLQKWFEQHVYPTGDGVIVVGRDLTEERLAADTLRNKRDMLRLAQQAGGVATFEWDFEHLVADCSPEFFRIFGLTGREGRITGAEWAEFVHPEDRGPMGEHLARALAGSEPARMDYRIITADGRTRWLSYAGEVQNTGRGTRMLGTMMDITDRKRLEEDLRANAAALRQATAEAESANHLKDHFLATLSHELRTPLNVILGYARLLRTDGIAPDNRQRAIEVIERNAMAQARLVEDLLDMSRIRTGKLRLESGIVDLEAILREAIDGIRPIAETKNVAVDLILDADAGTVRADSTRLQQVFGNLLTNAVTFTGAGGCVSAALRGDAGHVEVVVIDTGIGISPELLPHVFEPFKQGDGGLSQPRAGLGLGLAISRQLVEAHGGTLEAFSPGEGLGATFVARLPREPPTH